MEAEVPTHDTGPSEYGKQEVELKRLKSTAKMSISHDPLDCGDGVVEWKSTQDIQILLAGFRRRQAKSAEQEIIARLKFSISAKTDGS